MSLNVLREAVGEVAIGGLAGLDGLEPDPVRLGVSGDDLGFDERAFRLIDETEHMGLFGNRSHTEEVADRLIELRDDIETYA